MSGSLDMTDAEVRHLRDALYGAGKDDNWSACKEKWMEPGQIRWLADQVEKKEAKSA